MTLNNFHIFIYLCNSNMWGAGRVAVFGKTTPAEITPDEPDTDNADEGNPVYILIVFVYTLSSILFN